MKFKILTNKSEIHFYFIFSIISFIVFNKFLLNTNYFVLDPKDFGSDTFHTYFPLMSELFYNNSQFEFWNFKYGLGNNMLPNILTFSLDPFLWIDLIFFKKIETGLIYIHIFKLFIIAISFKKFILFYIESKETAILTSIIFTFSGYVMLWGQHYFFTNIVLYFILLLYSIELFYRKDNNWFLTLMLLINIIHLYWFIQIAFFLFIYLIFRCVYFNYTKVKFINDFKKLILITIIALLISSIYFLPYLNCLINNPRILINETSFFDKLIQWCTFQPKKFYSTLIGRFFSNNFMGNGKNYFGFENYYADPEVFSGLLYLLLIPQAFIIRNIQLKKAIIFLLIINLLLLFIPFFAYLFNAFQVLYYRFTFINVTINITSLALILDYILKTRHLNKFLLLGTFVGILFIIGGYLIYYRYNDGQWMYNHLVGGFNAQKYAYLKTIGIAIILIITLYFIIFYKFLSSNNLVYFLLILIPIELINENYLTYNDRGYISKNVNLYADWQTEKAIQQIYKVDKSKFFRIEKNYFSYFISYNDALVQDYNGVKQYYSFPNSSTVEFYKTFKVIDNNHWINILPMWEPDFIRYKLYNVLAIKYLLSKKKIRSAQFKLNFKKDSIYVYENKAYKSIGFTYNDFISKKTFLKIPNKKKDDTVNKKLIFEVSDSNIFKSIPLEVDCNSIPLSVERFTNEKIIGKISVKCSTFLYLSIPFDKGWHIIVDQKEEKLLKCNIGFMGVKLSKGTHNIKLFYKLPYFDIGITLSIIGVFFFIIYLYFKRNKVA